MRTKELKVSLIATFITALIIVSCFAIIPVRAEGAPDVYPKMAIITDNNYDQELGVYVVDCIDMKGHKWTFYDEEDVWSKGDIVNLLMWTCDTEIIEDDEIIEVYREGYINDPDLFSMVTDWRE